MKHFYAQNKGLHRWLIADGAVLLLFLLLRTSRKVMNFVVSRIALPLEQALGRACAGVSFSVAEVFYVLLIVDVLACLILVVRYVVRSAQKGQALYRCALFFADCALTVYALFCFLWGANYYIDDFCDKSGLSPQPIALEDLTAVTQQFADELAACADEVERDGDGLFAVPREEIFSDAVSSYATLYDEFPFLDTSDLTPKGIHFSRIMSYLDFTGFYFPFTGEANVNTDSPACMLPATMLHEMTHQRGIASEQQCNFLSILGSVQSGSAAYRYSGYLLGYIYLSNALYRVDYDAWLAMRQALPECVKLDLANQSAYWAQFEGPAAKTAQKLNDSMIRSYGDELGVQSYGAVVDLLVLYYK